MYNVQQKDKDLYMTQLQVFFLSLLRQQNVVAIPHYLFLFKTLVVLK